MSDHELKKIIVAVDTCDYSYALDIVDKLGEYVDIFKVGLELFVSAGPVIVREIQKRGKKVFLDLKFHDIPTTVSKVACVAAEMGVYMFNVHSLGGYDMLSRCKEDVVNLCLKKNLEKPNILGVTLLTSQSRNVLNDQLGIHHSVEGYVKHLAGMVKMAGLDGVVSSAQEARVIREKFGKKFLIITPGIRPSWSPIDDQVRTLTPKEAVSRGVDFLVMGRAILGQTNPINAIERINREIASV